MSNSQPVSPAKNNFLFFPIKDQLPHKLYLKIKYYFFFPLFGLFPFVKLYFGQWHRERTNVGLE